MPTITFGGIGSGIDVEGIIDGLVGASRGPINTLQSRRNSVNAAVSTLSDVGGLLSKLKSALGDLDTVQEVGSFSASSSDEAVVATAQGNALPGQFNVEVSQLASSQRTYTDSLGNSASTALSQAGTLSIQIGTEDAVDITVEATDTLDDLVGKINDADLRVVASSFFDGDEYRIQVRGLDTGADNALTFTETGTTLGFNTSGNTVESALDANLLVDGFAVTSSTNQIVGAISGVTLALTDTTTSPAQVTVESDPAVFEEKLKSFTDSFNSVVNKIHGTAGFGGLKASNPTLAGDSTLRGIEGRLSSLLTTTYGDGQYNSLASIGVQLNNDGTLKIDSTTLQEALEDNPDAVASLLAGDDSDDGVMDDLFDLVDEITDPIDGSLETRKEGLETRAKSLGDQIERETTRLASYEDNLRKQFTEMDTAVAGYQAQLQYLINNS